MKKEINIENKITKDSLPGKTEEEFDQLNKEYGKAFDRIQKKLIKAFEGKLSDTY